MLRARTEEQKKNVLEIFNTNVRYCHFPLDFNKETDWGYEEFDDRIYLDGDITFDKMCEVVEYLRKENEDVEYTRTDVFIEKVREFIKERFSFEDSWHVESETSILDKVIGDFKKYVEE